MRRGTTPTLHFKTTRDISGFETIILTLKDECRELNIKRDRLIFVDGGFDVQLTQRETLGFGSTIEAQVRACTADGVAIASTIATLDFKRILKEGVI